MLSNYVYEMCRALVSVIISGLSKQANFLNRAYRRPHVPLDSGTL
jgi:hypothetical protein